MTIAPSFTLLTLKQLCMIDLYAQGENRRVIGKELGLPSRQVCFHLEAITNVVGADSLDDAVRMYLEWRRA